MTVSGLPAGRVVVVSPHLDDAVFSLGSTIATAARTGATVRVLTVFAGDPKSETPAGGWDAATGFRTHGEAARARRDEDGIACAVLGAVPDWLPFPDAQYSGRPSDEVLSAALAAAFEDADSVLVPGFPLAHPDHVWLNELVLRRRLPRRARLGLYVEQPYAWRGKQPPPPPTPWVRLRGSRADRASKADAVRAYRSQLPMFGIRPRERLALHEALSGGETLAWV
jgi:LmbE family N-acetylglucosaminyl deacetylase